jgi:hypothetical protein
MECVVVKLFCFSMALMLRPQTSVSALLERAVVKNVSFSMAGICMGQKRQFQHGWNLLWSKSSVSAWLQYVLFKNVNYIMTGVCSGQNRLFQHCLNVEVTNASFSIAGMCGGQKCQFQNGWNMYWSKTSVSSWL